MGALRTPRAARPSRRSRLARYEEMADEAEQTRKLDFEEIQIPPGPRLGSIVLEAKSLKKGFDDRILIDGLSFTLPRNGIVGVIGPNGVGKTTLFKTIVGLEPLDAGELKIGETVEHRLRRPEPGRASTRRRPSGRSSPTASTTSRSGKVEMPSRAYVGAFGFKGPDQQKKAGVLSGGERNRLNLALTLKQGGNLLLLDEPTNDLDVETLGSPRERPARVPRAAPWSSPTTGGSSTGSRRTSSPTRARTRTRPSGTGSRATSSRTRRTRSSASARTRRARTASPTASSRGGNGWDG